MSKDRYVRLEEEEVEVLEEAMSRDFGSPTRVTKGGYIRLLASRRLNGEEAL